MRSQLAWGVVFFCLFGFFFLSSFSCVAVRRGMNLDFPLTKSTRTPLRSGGRSPSTPSSPCLLSGGWHSVRRLCCSPWSSCAQNLGGHGGVEVMEESGWRENRAGGKWVWLRAVRAAGDCSGLRSRCLSVSATGSSDCARTRPLIRFVLIIQPFFFVTN